MRQKYSDEVKTYFKRNSLWMGYKKCGLIGIQLTLADTFSVKAGDIPVIMEYKMAISSDELTHETLLQGIFKYRFCVEHFT